VRNIFEDRGGALWLATSEGGLRRLENGRFEAVAFGADAGRISVSTMFEDREGNLWIGTGGDGLYRLRRRLARSWTTENGLPSNGVHSIAIGPDDSIWLATKSGVAQIRDRVELVEKTFWDDGPNIIAVMKDGTVWVEGNGVHGFRMDGERRVSVHEETNASGNAFLLDRRGQLWLAGRELAVLADGHFERRIRKEQLEAKVSSMLEDHAGYLWFGTLGAGLKRFKDGSMITFKISDGLPDNSPLALLEDSDGSVWIGSSKGLARYRDGKFVTLSPREGLPEDLISQLLDDRAGNLWWGGLRGIYCARRADLNAIADGQTNRLNCLAYGEADGLAASETSGERQPTVGRTSDGRLWFAMEYGVGEIDPPKLLGAEVAPNVLVERAFANDKLVWSDGRSVPTEGTPASQGVVSSASVQLGKGQGGVVEIHYTATCLSGADRVRFRYRLDGHDAGWHEAGGSRVALYTNLRPGHYLFRVIACNEHGLWGDTGASLGVILAPKFTETKLFIVLCGAAAIGAGAAVQGIRLRTQRRILRLEHQREKERERTRLARDLHDELGTAMTGLALEMDVVRRGADEATGIAPRLARMADDARSLAERMREVVWAISPRSDDVPGVAVFLEQHATAFIESAGLECHLEYPEQIPPLPLASSVRHQLALGVREALTNVVRHARARKVTLRLRIEGQILVVVVQDDGIGFDPKRRSPGGNGLTSIENRLSGVGGTVVTDSRPGHGTSVRFQVPLIHTPRP
jgi:signal transduction histidine kinase/ligand-binding sensor domain-containing protein